jgi:hypothetical protein
MVRATGSCLVDFSGLWCRFVAEVGCIGYAVVMVVSDRGCGNLVGVAGNVVIWRRWRGLVDVEVLLPLIRQWVLSLLLLAEDGNGILQFC